MIRSIALVLTFLTGFSGLVYEVTWQKYFATLLGSHSEATAAVLGIFLGGLSLGYLLFGLVTSRTVERATRRGREPRLLSLYGGVEASIGLYALIFPALFGAVSEVSLHVPAMPSGWAFALDVGLTALLIGPPTVLMGGTIPVLTQALARGLRDATRIHARVYAINTAGAFAGALAAGFYLVPALGLPGVVRAMGLINLGAGLVFLALGRRRRTAPVEEAPAAAGATPVRADAPHPVSGDIRLYSAVALLSGFAMMCLQTVLIRLGGLALGASQFTFAMVVAVFVLCIALGSFAVSALGRIHSGLLVGSQWLLFAMLGLLYRYLPDAPYWAHMLRTRFGTQEGDFYPYHFTVFVAGLLVLGPSVGLSGATLPLLFHKLRDRAGELGGMAGRLYSWNTVGSLSGALLGGYALLFFVNLDGVYRVALVALAAGASLLTARHLAGRGAIAIGAAAIALLLVWQLPDWDPVLLSRGMFRARHRTPLDDRGPAAIASSFRVNGELLFYDDDPTTSVAVRHVAKPGVSEQIAIINNGKSDGSIPGDYPTMALAALVPALLAERVERAFVIGYGTGVTVGELAALSGMRDVVVAEISSAVLAAAPFFDAGNQHASTRPGLRVIRSDAYRALMRDDARYDVIVSEPSNPWVSGVEMLFSREFLEAARDRLRPGGVYAQWFHVYENDVETVSLVLRTYARVFDRVAVWYALGPDLLLLGFDGEASPGDLARLERRAREPDMAAGLARAGVDSLPALLAHELLPVGVIGAAKLPGEIHTLFHPILSDHAARAFFRGKVGRLPLLLGRRTQGIGARNSLLLRAGEASGDARAFWDAAAREVCRRVRRECVAMLARWLAAGADLAPVQQRLARYAKRAPHWAKSLKDGELVELAGFFAAGDPADAALSAETVAARAQSFTRFYHHAVPFSPEALRHLWDRCQPASEPACATGRRRAAAFAGRNVRR